jgi:hypothetical protein
MPGSFSRGWAIGTAGWRNAMAREQEHHALAAEMLATEIAELKSARWQRALEAASHEAGKELCDAEHAAKGADWKVAIAGRLRQSVAAPYRWISATLKMGHPGSVRGLVSRQNQRSAD